MAQALVFSGRGNMVREDQVLDPLTEQSPTLGEAEERAQLLAMQWIDEHLPWAR